MAISGDVLAPETVIRGARDTYTIINLIGRGGMGVVYRARRNSDGAVWALKEMRPQAELAPEDLAENRRLFVQEAELLRSLSYPNLPIVADLFEHDKRPTLVMEYVPGQTLEDMMHDANAPLLKNQVLGYGIQLCRVLHYLHTQSPPIIYRDLKPSNVMLTPEGVLKLIDFGVARTFKKTKQKDTIAMGSAGYAPPEQYGKGQTDARSDIYALGATLLHLLTALPPIPLQTPQPGSVTALNPSVDAATEAVIIKAMDLSRDQRFADCKEMEQALQRCLGQPFVDPSLRATPPPPALAPTVAGNGRVPQPAPQNAPPPPPPPQVQPQAQPPHPQVQPAADGRACPNCGRMNKAQAKFCSTCGTPLAALPIARLLVTSPYRSWEVRIEQPMFRIGRRDPRQSYYPELDLAEHDRGIASRRHATIERSGDAYTLTDLGSTNGTLLNGVLVAARAPQRLRQGDRIKIGEVEMEFRWS
jgi:serine/threonine protein kinase